MRSIGPYRIIAAVERKGANAVYLASHGAGSEANPIPLADLRVLKCVRTDDCTEDDIAHFLDEARLSALLDHPNVVRTYEAGEQDGYRYLVLEFLDGQALHSLLRHARRRGQWATLRPASLYIGIEALRGIHYAHELRDAAGVPLGVVHRDVSPQNLVITYGGDVKILDFGIAMGRERTTETVTGVFKGKARYMAPEQADGTKGAVDRRADLFAMGIVLWENLAEAPFWAVNKTDIEVLTALLTADFPTSLRAAGHDVPPSLDTAIARSLAYRPEDRYATAAEMLAALEEAAVDLPGHQAARATLARYLTAEFAPRRDALHQQIATELAKHRDRERSTAHLLGLRRVAVEPLTTEAFAPFGQVISGDRADVHSRLANQGTARRLDWLAEVQNVRPRAARLNLCLFRCSPRLTWPFPVEVLEKHPSSTQVLVPMNAERYVVVVALANGNAPDVTTLRAFLATGRQGIAYAPGTWHHPLIALDGETDFACVVWEDGGSGDNIVVSLPESDHLLVTLG